MLAPNLIILWPGSHATIPDGFIRVTGLDGRFAKGASAGNAGNSTGGNATHSHTSPTHSHNLNNHTHTGTFTNATSAGDTTNESGDAMGGNHYHTFTSSNPTGGASSSNAVTYGSVSNDPPFYELIFIQAVGYQPVPDGAIVLFSGDTIPDDFNFCDGDNGTPDLVDKFIKGPGTTQDAGNEGGSLTNIHDISHSHTANTHYHAGTSGTAINAVRRGSSAPPTTAVAYTGGTNHSHTFQLNNSTEPIDAFSGSLTTAETVQPAFTKLLAIQNNKGGATVALPHMVAMFLGDPDDIPAGWKLCDGNDDTVDMRGRHLKITDNPAHIGNTGGSNTHTHAAQSHTHTSTGGHVHTALSSISSHGAQNTKNNDPKAQYDAQSFNHALSGNTSSSNPGYADSDTTANSANNEPLFRTVLFLEFVFFPGGMHPDLE